MVLEKFRLQVYTHLREELIDEIVADPEVRLEEHAQFMADTVAVHIRMDILGRNLAKIECEYPATWWDAVKERWYPGWAKRRWPAQKIKHKLIARELYPLVSLPEKSPIVHLLIRRENAEEG